LPSLQGKTKTGGRLDAAAALGAGAVTAEINFVQHLYSDVLGRTGSAAEVNAWVGGMDGGLTSGQVANAFWQSAEHRTQEVDSYYSQYLHRAADPFGESMWVRAFLRGATESDVIRGFVTSAEYAAAHPTNLSFVGGLYADILGRSADSAGESAWVAFLNATNDRGMIANGFLNSQEYLQKTVNSFYIQYLQRQADAGGEQDWINAIAQGSISTGVAAINILASSEYFWRV
jgi:hypothetical protein